jgi:hypothetical protein
VTVTGVVLSLGPFVVVPTLSWSVVPMPYQVLAKLVPGFSTMRAPQRLGALATLGTIALAGLGLAWIRAALARRDRGVLGHVVAAVLVVAFLAELRPWTFGAAPVPTGSAVPPAYRWLAEHGEGAPLLELPIHRLDLRREARYMYYSTYHWLPLVNGYSSYPPPEWLAVAEAAGRLPDPSALSAVLAPNPRWVLWHRDAVVGADRAAWETTLASRLERRVDFGDAVLFERRG